MKSFLNLITFVLGFTGVIMFFGAPGGVDNGDINLLQCFLFEILALVIMLAARIVYNIRNIYFK